LSENSKTIEIDEIVTSDETPSSKADHARSADGSAGSASKPEDPLADLKKALGWKARVLAIPLAIIFMMVLIIRSAFRSFQSPR